MRIFLVARAWQMFVLLFGAMFIVPAVLPAAGAPHLAMAAGTLILALLFLGWLSSIAVETNRRLEADLRRSPRWMLAGLVYTVAYVATAFAALPGLASASGTVPTAILPFHLLAMFCMFYALLFTARQLVTLDRKEKVSFFDYSGPFFLLWFFPIGVWFVQPRVNQLLGGRHA